MVCSAWRSTISLSSGPAERSVTRMPGPSAKVKIMKLIGGEGAITVLYWYYGDIKAVFYLLVGTENFDMRKNQLTRQGFMELNLMEATEKDGDPADMWVTLEAMGYNRMLELVEVCIYGFSQNT